MNKAFAFSLAAVLAAGSSVALAHGPGGECGGPGKQAHFDKLDQNKDGAVTREELLAERTRHFDEADQNKDGKLTPEERKAGHEKHMQERFAKHDANKDGKLSAGELPPHMPAEKLKQLDSNGDGALNQTELAAHAGKHGGRAPQGSKHDETVTRAQIGTHVNEHFARLDSNKDGKLTQEELKSGHHGRGHGRAEHDQEDDE